ncbi:MAG: Ig-like domain-containing protein, partial [Gemmatimonadales bacterium]
MTRISQLGTYALLLSLAAGTLTCGGVTPPPDTATTIEMAAGNGQTGTVGQALPSPLVALVTDDNGSPVAGVSVSWAAQSGGSVSHSTATTGSDGRASVSRVLGPTAGAQTTTATVAGLTGSPVTFTSTAVDGPVGGGIAITINPPTQALTKEVFDPAAQPGVRVTDAVGPRAGVEVTASLASGSGTLEGTTTATTNATGDAVFGDLGINGTGDHTLEFTAGTETVTSSPITVTPVPGEATMGKWGPVVPWDIVPLHMNLLPNGKIFAWGKTEQGDTMGMPRVWDPAQGSPATAQMLNIPQML